MRAENYIALVDEMNDLIEDYAAISSKAHVIIKYDGKTNWKDGVNVSLFFEFDEPINVAKVRE